MPFCVAGARDCAPCRNWAKSAGFFEVSKALAGVGHLKRICQDAFCVAGAVQETCSSEMFGGQLADFPRGVAFWSMFRFAKMILRDRCSTSYDLASLSRGRRSTLHRWNGNFAKRIGTRPSALYSTFHFWRKSRRIASFLMLSTPKLEEVSQTCFVFDVVNLKNEERRRIAAFLMLSSSKNEEISQNSFVFNLAARQIDRQIDRQLQLPLHYTTLLLQLQIQINYTTLIALHYANYI